MAHVILGHDLQGSRGAMKKKDSLFIPVVLAGGRGSRLWPLSRSAYPKQFLPLVHEDKTLLQTTLSRLSAFAGVQSPIVVCHEDHRFIVAEQMQQLGVKSQAILLEPAAKNTAPAIALAAYWARKERPGAVLWVMPADHIIHDPDSLLNAFIAAQSALDKECLVAFGVKAQYPETAYGYIRVGDAIKEGVYAIDRFVEKPDLVTAESYVESGQYYWNCGIFAFKGEVYVRELERLSPKIAHSCDRAMREAERDGDFVRPNRKILAECPSDSIDYAVMEKTDRSVMTLLHASWNDVGSWDALMREHPLDDSGNVKLGDVITQDVNNSYLRSDHKMLAVSGVSDHVVVVTDDAVLVAHKNHCQNIKNLVESLKTNNREEAELHLTVHRPWGFYHNIAVGSSFKVKKITVNPKHRLSLQRHRHRSEHWVIISGEANIMMGDRFMTLRANESAFIPVNTLHRLSNDAQEILELIEVQVGTYLGEDDIERFSDAYGRVEEAIKR